jgi:GT2 family glycosyltransferase
MTSMTSRNVVASIIMATQNKASYLELTLASLERQSVPRDAWELIVVDDASSDETPDVLTRIEASGRLPLRWVRSEYVRGRSGARNHALRAATGRVVVFLDDDRLVGPDFLLYHLSHHEGAPSVVFGDTRLYIHTHVSSEIDPSVWGLAGLLMRGLSPLDEGRVYRLLEPDDVRLGKDMDALIFPGIDVAWQLPYYLSQNIPPPPLWLYFTTGNASVPRESVNTVGGFDEEYQGWGLEDNDLALRLAELGLPFRFETCVATVHQVHPKGPKHAEEHRNNLDLFFRKHPHLPAAVLRPQLEGTVPPWEWVSEQRAASPALPKSAPAEPPSPLNVVWTVRGSGIGNARRSEALWTEWKRIRPDLNVTIASYGEAADWLRGRGHQVYELNGKSYYPIHERYQRLSTLVRSSSPEMVIADEETSALTVAAAAGVPSVYLASSLPDVKRHPEGEYIRLASKILVADVPEAFPLPAAFFGQATFCGPWLHDTDDDDADADVAAAAAAVGGNSRGRERLDWRRLLAVGASDHLIVIAAYETQQEALPSFIRLLEALGSEADAVFAVAAGRSLGEALRRHMAVQAPAGTRVHLLHTVPEALPLCRHADMVVVPPGEHTLLWELSVAGVPTLALTSVGQPGSQPPAAQGRIVLPEEAERGQLIDAFRRLSGARVTYPSGRSVRPEFPFSIAERRRKAAQLLDETFACIRSPAGLRFFGLALPGLGTGAPPV